MHMFSGVCLVCIVYVCYAHACLVSRRNTIDDDDDDDDDDSPINALSE